ncbi:MAG: hypothetical protein ACQRW7_11330 [Caulobacterales bacterium]|uniref:hypothetical protein n=1 Tax=Glycocaulis sp. TaxID=1969725 RepID=UPI003F9F2642
MRVYALCPQVEHAPRTLEGRAVLDMVLGGGCIRTGFAGMEGVDLPALADRLPDMDRDVRTELALALEAGLMAGMSKKKSQALSST